MPQVKYFAEIETAQHNQSSNADPANHAFDLTALSPVGWKAKLSAKLFIALIGPLYALARRFFPIFKAVGFYHITRDADVRAVLSQPDTFSVPFGTEMEELVDGAIFALGMDGPAQARQNRLVRMVLKPEDGATITQLASQSAEALIANSGGRIDAVNDLFKLAVTETCIRYFGLDVDDTDSFADWMIACSMFLFGDPYGDPKIRAQAMAGAGRLRLKFDDAIRRAKVARMAGGTFSMEPLVHRLVELQAAKPASDPISDAEIRAILFGVMTGFVPTNTLASGKMLDELLRRPAAWQAAVAAAQQGSAGMPRLRLILLEAGRLNPAISPGVWRYCAQDAVLAGKKIPAGSTLLVSTMSALHDARAIPQPRRFWPYRVDKTGTPVGPDLMFGNGIHECLGKYLAMDQITAVFAALLRQPGLAPAKGKAGKLQSIGPYPRHLVLCFDTPAATQSMFLVIAKVTSGVSKYGLDKEIAALGNPADRAIAARLDNTGIVHFCSLATIPSDDGLKLVLELSVDGTIAAAVNALAQHCDDLLRPIFAHSGLAADADLAKFLQRNVVELHGKMWGATGLNYNGLAEFPVASVAKQARFADFVERAISDALSTEAQRGSHPMRLLAHVRRILRQDSVLTQGATPERLALMAEAAREGFDSFRLIPTAKPLRLAEFRPPTKWAAFGKFLLSRESGIMTGPIAVAALLFGIALRRMWPGQADAMIAEQVLRWAGIGLGAIVLALITAATLAWAFFAAIRRDEARSSVDTTMAPLDHIAALTRQEDAPGFAQNHILALGEIKPGLLRNFAHAFALWAIKMVILFDYRPGFVINMGTIHYARWWRMPGTKQVAFYSNFDGSWESYLEDFITRARWGQTAVWSNWQGFPETRYLLFKGAEDGDRFKRWVRGHQQIVPFWYSRFPILSTDRIRTNALIHSGVAKARTSSEAEEWLRCFGSMPKVENLIETDEVQALVFSGMKRLKVSTCLVLKLPQGVALGEWLGWIRGETQTAADYDPTWLDALMEAGIILPVKAADNTIAGYCLSQSLTLTFGDRPLVGEGGLAKPALSADSDQPLGRFDAARMAHRAVFFACSATGIDRFNPKLSHAFPGSFRMGMAARGRQMGDYGVQSAEYWRWRDGDNSAEAHNAAAEAVLFVYAETADDLAYASQVHASLLENFGGAIISRIDCAPARPDAPQDQENIEHFGYRDGISQPVIKGTARALRDVPARDLIEPGEFILGYASGQGFYPPSPVIAASQDVRGHLPVLDQQVLSRYPDFGAGTFADSPRDLGRNGSYVVIRELAQDVDGFEAFVQQKAAELRGSCPAASASQTDYKDIYKVIGQHPDADWIKAKLMGRWPNGRPLVGNPLNQPLAAPDDAKAVADEADNDFAFGSDDPQGLACPFGAHIRRTNPRDSKQPGDKAEQGITNRHRLIRRGRPYLRTSETGTEKGLLFVSLCTDLERQFEFVQQVWAVSPTFHGLCNEPDPIVGGDIPDPNSADGAMMARSFTIPTAAGPIKLTGMQSFVTVKAGGYFFMPSRSALSYLTDVALNTAEDK